MPFDRAAIFRSAHENARRKLRWSGFKGTYRQAFSIALQGLELGLTVIYDCGEG